VSLQFHLKELNVEGSIALTLTTTFLAVIRCNLKQHSAKAERQLKVKKEKEIAGILVLVEVQNGYGYVFHITDTVVVNISAKRVRRVSLMK
jgi:hypothetical protein